MHKAIFWLNRLGKPVRKPFSWRGGLWVCTGIHHYGQDLTAYAYRLVHPALFDGTVASYAQRANNGDASRADPQGYYHGISVRHGGADYVLCGPERAFVPGQSEQLALF